MGNAQPVTAITITSMGLKMIVVDLGRIKLGMAFSHPKQTVKPFRRITVCKLYDILANGNEQLLVAAETVCSRQDNFCKSTGRKLALGRALCQHIYNYKTKLCKKCGVVFTAAGVGVKLTKAERELVWAAYWKRGTITPAATTTVVATVIPISEVQGGRSDQGTVEAIPI